MEKEKKRREMREETEIERGKDRGEKRERKGYVEGERKGG